MPSARLEITKSQYEQQYGRYSPQQTLTVEFGADQNRYCCACGVRPYLLAETETIVIDTNTATVIFLVQA